MTKPLSPRLLAVFSLAWLSLTPIAVVAAPDNVVRQSVAVCDPNNPKNCLQPNTSGSLLSPIAPSSTTAASSNIVLKSSAGSLCGLNVVSGATAGYVMLFDATSAPADGAVTPKWVLTLATNTAYSGSPSGSDACMSFATGITAVFSSTGPFTKTASPTAFISGYVR